MIRNIKDLTSELADGRNCLVHCAGGNGRTGMVVAGVLKNVGHRDPITWVRRVKTKYVETIAQEDFVQAMPTVLDPSFGERHPDLARAIAAEQIIHFLVGETHHVPPGTPGSSSEDKVKPSEEQLKNFDLAFDLIDKDKNGFLTMGELKDLFKKFGADLNLPALKKLFKDRGDHHKIARDEFVNIMIKSWLFSLFCVLLFLLAEICMRVCMVKVE